MKYQIYLLLIFVITGACKDEITTNEKYQRMTVSVADSVMEFRITDKEVAEKSGREYWWFKGGYVHHQVGGYSGKLLEGEFVVYGNDGRMLQKGIFKNGMKQGLWRYWSGENLVSTVEYKNGRKNGRYVMVDTGRRVVDGTFSDDQKDGKFTYQTDSVVTFIKYKKGTAVDTTVSNPGSKPLFQWLRGTQ